MERMNGVAAMDVEATVEGFLDDLLQALDIPEQWPTRSRQQQQQQQQQNEEAPTATTKQTAAGSAQTEMEQQQDYPMPQIVFDPPQSRQQKAATIDGDEVSKNKKIAVGSDASLESEGTEESTDTEDGGKQGTPPSNGTSSSKKSNNSEKKKKKKRTPKKHSEAYFQQRIDTLRGRIQKVIPDPEQLIDSAGGGAYRPLLRALEAARQTLASSQSAQTTVQQEQKKHKDDDGWKDKSLVDSIQDTSEQAQATIDALDEAATDIACAMVAASGLMPNGNDDKPQGILKSIEHDLLECTVLIQAQPKKLAEWVAKAPEKNGGMLDKFLGCRCAKRSLMGEFLCAGGPSRGNYGRALEIWHDILAWERYWRRSPGESTALRQRLAIAVALEHATPVPIFHQKNAVVNPLERFRYFTKFHRGKYDDYNGDVLDKAFAGLTTWELRKVVDSDATHADLDWGREFLRNYRPDQITTKDSKWRYNRSVRTDVGYRHPDHEFSNYPELLSAGGECGARAWFGRFACKSWGIPTWGVRQPGHAAMTRWTDDGSGWQTCLGAGWQWSWWDDDRYGAHGSRNGPDFLDEAGARSAVASPSHYYDKVILLECLAECWGETVEETFKVDKVWRSLALAQRKKLAREVASSSSRSPLADPSGAVIKSDDDPHQPHETFRQLTMTTTTTTRKRIGPGSLKDAPAGTIVIPAASFVQPAKPTNDVMVLNSYGGGTQLHLEHDGKVEYKLPENAGSGTYLVSLSVVNVHRNQQSLSIEILDDDDDHSNDSDDEGYALVSLPTYAYTKTCELEVPYTKGYWMDTKTVQVELPGGGCRLGLSRGAPNSGTYHGLSIRDIVLQPVQELIARS